MEHYYNIVIFILSDLFDAQNEYISLPDHGALHVDHKYL